MEEVTTPDPIVEIALPDPEPVVQPTMPDEVKTQELSPSNPPNVDNSETPQVAITSDNLVAPEVQAVPDKRPDPKWLGDSCPVEECEHKKAWRLLNDVPLKRDALGHFVEGNTESVGANSGRPCKYCENKASIMVTVHKYLKRCKEGENGKQIMPFLEELCIELDIDEDTIVNWAVKKDKNDELEHPEFFGAWKKIKIYQKLRLQQRTMGRFNPTGAIFLLKVNHNMIESEKRIIAGDAKEPLEIKIIEEDREKYQE